MSSDSEPAGHRVDKGKGRARSPDPTESTPLLGSTSGSYISSVDPESPPHTRRLYSRLLTVFLASLSLCFLALLLLIIIILSYRARAVSASPDEIIRHALVLRGPDRVDVLNTTGDGGIWMKIHGRVGIDAGHVAGVNTAEGDSLVGDAWKAIGRWGIRRLDKVSVNLSTIAVVPEGDPGNTLTTITLPPLELALTANPPSDNSWLTPVAIPVLIRPTKDAKTLMRFVRQSWKEGTIRVQASIEQVNVTGGGLSDGGWRRRVRISHSDIQTAVHISIPRLPGLPHPGDDLPDASQFVNLESFLIKSANDTLTISANAIITNPIQSSLNATVPSLPFIVYLPPNGTSPPVPLAHVQSPPFAFSYGNISLALTGVVLPLPRNASGALSDFLGAYVSAHDADILLETTLLPDVRVPTRFPAPHPPPQILHDVKIKDMKVKPVGQGMVASGTVLARVVLPPGIEVGIDVVRVFPDVLVYDGEVPEGGARVERRPDFKVLNFPVDDGDRDVPPQPPLPDPLPERAFAHIRPDDWLPALSVPGEQGPGEGTVVNVTAEIVEVPLEVLPGREREFSNFVSKVVFGTQGALAGLQGEAAVAVHVNGLPFENGRDGEMQLTGLPFKGNVRIGKRSMLDGSLMD
ncbi:uncharacterized protein B0H18DRAFT_1020320 [Fomitopsis serialis]|uniref:uncharacterized protein n=1 Tax=Fomitopsis serialis TaxID=139415 RepID=UPI002007C8F2|nr:uncharacterized protein B0H18DRAFT_1020320 [Neoantrodia serialis]KAH9921816.1 hypothetical protein B0H18DRAFT_1020320 [Neoantrodia serialis]